MSHRFAPDPHAHGHDVGALSQWMGDVTAATDRAIAKGKRAVEGGMGPAGGLLSSQATDTLTEELYTKGKMYTVFHNELARQAAVHCPRVARCGPGSIRFCPLGVCSLPGPRGRKRAFAPPSARTLL